MYRIDVFKLFYARKMDVKIIQYFNKLVRFKNDDPAVLIILSCVLQPFLHVSFVKKLWYIFWHNIVISIIIILYSYMCVILKCNEKCIIGSSIA